MKKNLNGKWDFLSNTLGLWLSNNRDSSLFILTWKRHVWMSRGKASKLIAQIKVILVAKTYSISEFWFTHSPCNLSKTSNAWKIFRLSTSTSGNQTWKCTKNVQETYNCINRYLNLRISKNFTFTNHNTLWK